MSKKTTKKDRYTTDLELDDLGVVLTLSGTGEEGFSLYDCRKHHWIFYGVDIKIKKMAPKEKKINKQKR
jgi:hypothetical protein